MAQGGHGDRWLAPSAKDPRGRRQCGRCLRDPEAQAGQTCDIASCRPLPKKFSATLVQEAKAVGAPKTKYWWSRWQKLSQAEKLEFEAMTELPPLDLGSLTPKRTQRGNPHMPPRNIHGVLTTADNMTGSYLVKCRRTRRHQSINSKSRTKLQYHWRIHCCKPVCNMAAKSPATIRALRVQCACDNSWRQS